MKFLKFAVFFAGILALAGLALYAGIHDVTKTLAALGWGGFLLITFLHVLVIAAMGVAWWRVAQSGTSLQFVAARWVRDSVAEVLPFSQIGGYVSGARAASLGGPPISQSALSMFADLVVEFAAKLVYVLAAILSLARLLPGDDLILPLLAMVAVAFLGFLLAGLYRVRVKRSLEYWAGRLIARWAPGANAELELGRYFRWPLLWPCFVIHLACWFFGAFEAWLTLHLMGVNVSGGEALVIDSLATSLAALGFMVPGAIGVQEGGYVLVSLLFGIAPAQAIAFSLARRARDVAVGVPGLALWQYLEARAFRRPIEQN